MTLFPQQLAGELRKLFARRRTYIGYGVFIVFELVLLIAFKLEKSQAAMRKLLEQNGEAFETYYTSLTVTYWVMSFSMFLLGSIFFALVSGDIVAKEAEDGNLRLVLARPVSRLRILVIKYVATIIYTISFVAFVGITGYLMAIAAVGWDGGLFIWNYKMQTFAVFPDWSEGFTRLAIAAGLIGISMCTLSSVGFCLGCFKMKPATATILALSLLFVDMVLQEFPFLKPYEEHFITYKMSTWVFALREYPSWASIIDSYSFLAGLNLTLFVLGWLAFASRDFKT